MIAGMLTGAVDTSCGIGIACARGVVFGSCFDTCIGMIDVNDCDIYISGS